MKKYLLLGLALCLSINLVFATGNPSDKYKKRVTQPSASRYSIQKSNSTSKQTEWMYTLSPTEKVERLKKQAWLLRNAIGDEKIPLFNRFYFEIILPHAESIGIYLDKKWYKLEFYKELCQGEKAVERLDCAILQNNVLSAILGIGDPRTDKRIDFAGGIRGLEYLEERCEKDCKMAISMYPTSLNDLMSVADDGDVMPPKSTWFEPKLRSGLLIHKI